MDNDLVPFVLLATLLALAALAIVLRPLWRSRPAPTTAIIVGLMLAAFGLYQVLGTPAALDPGSREAPKTMQDAIAMLRAKLEQQPGQVEGWRLLARSYATEGQLPEARDAAARAAELAPSDPDVLVEAAEASALASPNHMFDPQAVAQLRHALDLQPMHQRARWFLGVAQRQAQQPAEAAKTWEPLLAEVDAGTAANLRVQIDSAREDAGLPPLPPAPAASPAPAGTPAAAAAGAASIAVSVSLDPALASRLPDDAALFVIARQPGGPPMPVAAEKLAARGFPLVVTLDDSDSPMPTLKLSQLDKVELRVRVSASGDATAQAGDLEAAPLLVTVAPHAVAAVTIDRVVP